MVVTAGEGSPPRDRPTVSVAVDATTVGGIAAAVRALRDPVAACYVAGEGMGAVIEKLEQATGRPVVTPEAARTVVLAATVVLHLRRLRVPSNAARVLVAGARADPALTPLPSSCGVPDLTLWNSADDDMLARLCVSAVVAAAHDGLRPADAATHPAVTAAVRAATHEHLLLRRLARES